MHNEGLRQLLSGGDGPSAMHRPDQQRAPPRPQLAVGAMGAGGSFNKGSALESLKGASVEDYAAVLGELKGEELERVKTALGKLDEGAKKGDIKFDVNVKVTLVNAKDVADEWDRKNIFKKLGANVASKDRETILKQNVSKFVKNDVPKHLPKRFAGLTLEELPTNESSEFRYHATAKLPKEAKQAHEMIMIVKIDLNQVILGNQLGTNLDTKLKVQIELDVQEAQLIALACDYCFSHASAGCEIQ